MNRKVVSAGGGAKLVVSAAAGGVKTSGQFLMKKGDSFHTSSLVPCLKGQFSKILDMFLFISNFQGQIL
jgi:hypothetical protein